MSARDLAKELQDGIQEWTGPSIFASSSSRQPVQSGSGSKERPILVDDIASPSTSTFARRGVRGVVRYTSPLPRTAYTPPKAVPVHPFFHRSRSAPISTPVPAAHRPRLVAHYSSTDASQSQSQTPSQSSQSTFGQASQSPVKGKGKERGKDKGKGRATTTLTTTRPPTGWSAEAVDQMADSLAKVQISRRQPLQNRSTVPTTSRPTGAPAAAGVSAAPRPKVLTPSAPLPFFHHAAQPNPPKIAYTTDLSEADDLLACLQGDVVGFDLEWPPAGKYETVHPTTGKMVTHWVGRTYDKTRNRYTFTPGQTALVQVCDRNLVVLIHLKDTKDLPGSVVDLVQDKSKYKLGVQIAGDGRKLLSDFSKQLTRACSLLELSRLARRVDGEAIGPGNTLISLAKLSERYLGQTLRKDAGVRRGDWSRALSQEQIDYAANDVYASYLIYDRLRALAEERNLSLDLPSYCSYLGDTPGTPPTKAGAKAALARGGGVGGLAPTPAQARTIEMFVSGQTTEVIASTMGVQRSTVQGYLAAGLARAHEDVLNDDEKRRFLDDVRGVYWVERNHLAIIKRIQADLARGDGEAGAESDTAPT